MHGEVSDPMRASRLESRPRVGIGGIQGDLFSARVGHDINVTERSREAGIKSGDPVAKVGRDAD
jgi:hypothetical protein